MTSIVLNIGFAVSGIVFVASIYMLIRNEWVFRQQMKFVDEAFDRPAMEWFELGCPTSDDLCDSHNEMMRRFWVWDREKFRRSRLPSPIRETENV